MEDEKYTLKIYSRFQVCIDEIEKRFFTGKGKFAIPSFVFALNNLCSSVANAYVTPEALYDKETGRKVQYLGINPQKLNRNPKEIMTTLCHELCHIYENEYIHIPRGGYHDKHWDSLLTDCGLEAVYLNKSRTSVSTKIVEGGEFDTFCNEFLADKGENYFSVIDYGIAVMARIAKTESDGALPCADNADKPKAKAKTGKIKYVCPCGNRVWGKKDLSITCNDCGSEFEADDN